MFNNKSIHHFRCKNWEEHYLEDRWGVTLTLINRSEANKKTKCLSSVLQLQQSVVMLGRRSTSLKYLKLLSQVTLYRILQFNWTKKQIITKALLAFTHLFKTIFYTHFQKNILEKHHVETEQDTHCNLHKLHMTVEIRTKGFNKVVIQKIIKLFNSEQLQCFCMNNGSDDCVQHISVHCYGARVFLLVTHTDLINPVSSCSKKVFSAKMLLLPKFKWQTVSDWSE